MYIMENLFFDFEKNLDYYKYDILDYFCIYLFYCIIREIKNIFIFRILINFSINLYFYYKL